MKPIEQVIKFQRIFGDEVNDLGTIPSIEKRKLRLKLIFEELSELAEAYGLKSTFGEICEDYTHKIVDCDILDNHKYDEVEALDAISDLLVVVYGGACINGQSSIIDEAFDETMRSNMSKSCKTLDQALYTIAQYHKEGRDTYYKLVDGLYIIYDSNTNKILKNKDENEGFFTPHYNKMLNGN